MRLIDPIELKRSIAVSSMIHDGKTLEQIIDEQPTVNQWISCSERLPEVSGCYLVSVKNDHERRYSKTAWFEKGTWLARQDVVAWMPLPKPYQEADK